MPEVKLVFKQEHVEARMHKLGYHKYLIRKLPKFVYMVIPYARLVRWERSIRWKLRKPAEWVPMEYVVNESECLQHRNLSADIKSILGGSSG